MVEQRRVNITNMEDGWDDKSSHRVGIMCKRIFLHFYILQLWHHQKTYQTPRKMSWVMKIIFYQISVAILAGNQQWNELRLPKDNQLIDQIQNYRTGPVSNHGETYVEIRTEISGSSSLSLYLSLYLPSLLIWEENRRQIERRGGGHSDKSKWVSQIKMNNIHLA